MLDQVKDIAILRVVSGSGSLTAIQRGLEALLRLSASRRVYAHQASKAEVSISQQAYVLLRRIHQDGPLAMGELARRTHMDPGATARQIAALEGKGLVRRYPSPQDGRVSLVEVTPGGDEVRVRLSAITNDHMVQVLSGWSDRDQKSFARLLGKFVDDLRARGEQQTTASNGSSPR